MEELVENNIEFFSSPEEAIEKAKHILQHGLTPITGDEYRFTSASKVHKLDALIERYLKRTEDWII